ncbi:autotransporter-associated beta strand repeat-containing protein [Sphingopyxis sp. MWB1]|uniref:autotransporter-associated beta strand repeat-containing protein n=1 Tax=Sphingopyxis sp. MWB1 TaxID=1537715 RepID=UPI00051A2450|nr:autotransporter-associated beta strand repeat-containing protein [Sphingopyxis sp. MWB1]
MMRAGVCRWALLAMAAVGSPASSWGQETVRWDVNGTAIGEGGTGTWDETAPAWSLSADGVSGPFRPWNNAALDDAIFGGSAGTVTVNAPITVRNITFQTNGYIITGGTLNLRGANPTLTVTTGASTIGSRVTTDGGWTKAGGGNLALNGANTFGGGIDITGGGLTLNAANSFTGTINATGGSLTIGAIGDAALGSSGNVINLGNSRTLTANGMISASRTINIDSGIGNIRGGGLGDAFYTGAGGLNVGAGIALTNDASNYQGQTQFTTLPGWGGISNSFSSIGNLGEASALGAPTTVANGTILLGPGCCQALGNSILGYTGTGHSSNRNWNFRPGNYSGGVFLHNNGSGALTLTGDISATGGSRPFGFSANSADMNLLGVISSNSGRTAFFSAGSGHTLRLGTANIFSGTASIGGAGLVEAALFSHVGVAGSLGTGAISINGGNLSYVGAGESTNKSFGISNGSLNSNGAGALTLSGPMGITNTATLGGSFTGADNVISGVISGTGNLRGAGSGTWLVTGDNSYTGQTIVDSGILRAGSATAFAGSTRFDVNGGTLDLNDFDQTLTALTGTGGTLDLGTALLKIDGPTGTSASFGGSITGNGGLSKMGNSTQTLTGASSYSGDTRVGGGTLALDFSSTGGPLSNIIGSDSTLRMAGGTLRVTGAANESNTQTFDGLVISAGNNMISAVSGTGGSMTINLGAITRTGGLMNFVLPSSGNITTTNTALGGWATVNGTDYAKVVGGNIQAFTDADYTDKDNAANWVPDEYITDVAGFFGTVTGTKQLGGLRYTQAVSTTVTVDAGETLGVDGTIIVAPTVMGGNQQITGGMMTGASGGVLGIQQNSTGNFTIGSQIVDNGPGMGFTKAGTGLVTLSNTANSYTGATRVVHGTLAVASVRNGGAASSIGASSAASSNLVLEGSTLRYTGGGDSSDRGFVFDKSGAILGSGIEVTNAAANLTLSGLVTSPGDAAFTKSGPGTLTLANSANDFTGVITVNGGLLGATTLADGGQVSSIGAGSNAPSSLILNGGGLQYTGGTTTSNRGFTLGASGGIVDVTSAATILTNSGVVVGGGRLTKNGAGTLVLTGANTHTGGNSINNGVLRAGAANVFGALTGSSTNLADAAGAVLDLNNFDNLIGPLNGGGAMGGNVTLGSGTLRIASGNGDYSGVISGTGGVWRTNGGNQTFNGCNNSYTGATTLQGAAITVDCLANGGQASGIGASSSASANLVFISGSLNYTGGTISIDRGFSLTGYGVINVTNAASTLGFSGQIVGGGELYKDGPGTMVLSGNNSYTNNTRVRGGILRAGSATAFGATNSFWLNNTAGVLLDLNDFSATARSLIGGGSLGGNIALGTGTLTIGDGASQTYAGAISGSGNLVKSGGGNQRLAGCDSSYTGVTTINAGTLTVDCLANGGFNSSIGASSSGPANLVINGTLNYVGAGSSTNRQFTLGASGGTIDSSGTGALALTYGGAVTLASPGTTRTLTLTGTNVGENIFAARLDNSGTTRLVKAGAGTWRLTNSASTYTGATTISGGILIVDKLSDGGAASSIGASTNVASNLVIGNGSTLRYVGTGDSTDRRFTLDTGVTYIQSSGTGALIFANTGTVGLNGTNAMRTIVLGGTNTGSNTMGGAIADNGTGRTTLAKNDSGTWVLTGNNSFTGNTVINDGNLMVGNGGTTGNAGAGNVIVDSATSTLSLNRSDTFLFSGTLSGPGTLAQIGTGTSILTSALNNIGATTISGGTLQIGDGTSGALTTPTLAMTGNSALVVNGMLQGTAGAQTVITGDGGSQVVRLGNGVTMRATGNLGDGADRVELFGTVNTAGGTLSLGAGDDTLALYDGAGISAAFVDGGAGSDLLQVINAAALTVDGANVNGFERLEKQAAGTLTLTGNHSYSGGTTITTGTLRIGNGGGSGALAGDVANNALLEFNRSGTLAVTGAISGTGAVRQIGSGTTILSGVNSYQGGTNVTAGTLQVSGDANLGTSSGGLTLTGGRLNTTASFTSNRAVELAGAGNISTDAGTVLTLAGALSGPGTLTKTGAGTLTLTADNGYTGLTTISAGTLQIGYGGTAGSIAGNLLNNSALLFNRAGTLTMGGMIIGGGSVTQSGPGTTILTGNNSYAGPTIVNSGVLLVNGDQSGATNLTSVASGATLGGIGTIGGSVIIADGGTLAAGSNGVGALTINGGLALGNASLVDFEFGQANVPGGPLNDLVNVGGDLVLDGVVNVTQAPGGSFGPGVYRMFNYSGALTDNGLSVGTMPPGSDVFVQTAIGGQVNLANTAGLMLNFWDGTGQPKNDGAIQGGDGIWRVSGNQIDWTDVNGTVNADYAQDSFAIFQGTGGTVTVDNVGGNVLSAGMQFAVDGYTIAGGPLTLTGVDAWVRIGDGSPADGAITTTITAQLAGSARLVKDLGGTLVLAGANSYTGGTAINDGTLRISSDTNLGDAAGSLSFNGGTLNTTANIVSARAVDLAGAGRFLTDGGTTLTLAGVVSGAGALTKEGGGSLILTNANTYGGGTTIGAGSLHLGAGGTAGSLVGDVFNNGQLAFNRSDSLIFAGAITGDGMVSQIGPGKTILTGNGSYRGGTTITAGELLLGNGGTTGGITGDVLNNAAFGFNRSDAVTFSGMISGTGTFAQIGSGTTILTGANSYTGASTVSAGTLLVNGDQSAATGVTSVALGATLGGVGTIGGDVAIADRGILAPGGADGPGTLAINGHLALAGGSTLNYDFGQANVIGGAFNDLVNVGGDLLLDGTLNVVTSAGGSFDPGIYRVINYAGALTNNGLMIGAIPAGTDFFVQTSVPNQVNLINTNGLALRFWDGASGGRNDAIITGGDGVWQNISGNDNWTLDDASINAPFLDSAFAIFGGIGGTVTVDGGLGAINVAGMQFASEGYAIEGDPINLTGAPVSVIRVGDGSASGAAITATIASDLLGASQLVKTDMGTLVLTGTNGYTGGTAMNGGTLRIASDVNLGAAGSGLSFNGGTLHTTADVTSSRAVDLIGAGTLATETGTFLTLSGVISGVGGVTKVGTGNLVLTGTNSYAGDTIVTAGSLFVNGDQSAATGLVSIASGALLGGSGIIGGNVMLADGATLAAGAGNVGTLSVGGNLMLSAGSVLDFEFGAANVAGGSLNDLVNVGGDLTLAGTVNVSVPATGSFGPGIYRAFNYGGTLTDNGLTLGTMPAGSMVSVQTAIGGQVNLVNTAGLNLSFWDGNAGPKNNGAVNGGDGVWRIVGGSNNWTDLNGSVNADYAQGSFAIFSAAPGTVTIDDAGGMVQASGMQFASDGYILTGDALTLTGARAIVQVGDSSAAGAGFSASITAELAGTAGLVKTDAGTLILTGANSFSGGTAVTGGTLRVSNDANLGDAAGGLLLDGGTLNTTADMGSNRAVDLAGAGSFLTEGGTVLTLNGTITGGGLLTKDGAGSLVLAADNAYTGGTSIAAGRLQLGNGGTTGRIVGNVANDGLLAFNRSDRVVFAGAITGNGALSQIGSGTTILAADNRYGGGTTIGAGTLQIGNGGTTGSITGNVLNNAALAFDRSDGVTFAGLISGNGTLTQTGGGILTLTGANSYVGVTRVAAGTLLVNGDQSAASGATNVAAGATLGGTGIIGGNVSLADGAALMPGAGGAGALTINGDLSLAAGASLGYDFGLANAPGSPLNDVVNVVGDLVLDGTIDVTVTPGGSFDIGLYRVINYGGTLTDNGLAIGTMPAGSDVFVQAAVANQINLINTGGVTLNFWDGAAGPKFNGAVNGGHGVWQSGTGNDNWADATGAVNASFDDGAFAIFTGAPGSVTIDNSLGAVTVSGMQFAVDGYSLIGGDLTLTGAQSVVRVGDGTAAGAGYTTTIASAIMGGSQLVKTDAGTLILVGSNSYSGGTAINGGTLQISSDANLGDAAGGLVFGGGTLNTTASFNAVRAVDLAGIGTISTDGGTTLGLSGTISGGGSLTKSGAGTLVLGGVGSYSGGTAVTAGTLLVNGNYAGVSSLTSVASGASLGGTGTLGGDVTLADGAMLAPGAGGAGTLNIGGNLSLGGGTRLAWELGEAGVVGGSLNDLVNVGGNLILDGTLDVTVPTGGAFDVGVYRLFNYGGTLTNNGLGLGIMPAGSDVAVQTSVAGQVNLVNAAGLTLNFWDGGAGPKNDGIVNGGDGIWQASGGNDNWTDANGNPNAAYSDAAFAVFGGTGGIVTVDNGVGQVAASGMQFASDGYMITGGNILLAAPNSIIRVGDGSASGAGITATIAAVLSGDAQLVKSDAGTLILSGVNSYTGGTAITGGTVQIAADAGLGAATGNVTLDGGTLATSASLASTRDILMAGAGTIATAADTVFTYGGAFSGTGALTKSGAGTLLVTGDNAGFTGATNVAAGTLAVTGVLGGAVSVNRDGRLEGTGTVGDLANSGVVAPGREGFGTLTVTGSYTGAGGTLEIEAALGGDASLTDRLVVANGTSGTTAINLVNRGGLGAQTMEGIKIIDVTGGLSAGIFTLNGDYDFEGSPAVIAGAYGYRLFQGGVSAPDDGDWYLRSALLDPIGPLGPLYQPGVPLYESYAATLQTLNRLPTLQQRVGNRQWSGFTQGGVGMWGRIESTRHRPDAAFSTSRADLDVDNWSLQAGFDKALVDNAEDIIIAGINGRYGTADASIGSRFGDGSIDTQGYGLGATLTWYESTGFYADAQAQVSWYRSDLASDVLGTLIDNNHGSGETFSLEVGKRSPVGGGLSVTPQIQMIYSHVRFGSFTDPSEAYVSSDMSGSLQTRWGIALDHQRIWDGSDGARRSHLYGIVNLRYEWLDGSIVGVSGTPLARRDERLWGEVGIGGSYSWSDDRFTLFTELSLDTAIDDFGDSNSLRGDTGFRMKF